MLSVTDFTLAAPATALTLTLQPKLDLAGTVQTPTGAALTAATVNATPTQPPPLSYWLSTHALPPISVRPAVATTDDKGAFAMFVDWGTMDVTIQPAAGSGFPWRVLPAQDPLQVNHTLAAQQLQ